MIKGIVFDLDGTLIQLPIDYKKIQKDLKEFFNISNELKPLIPTIIKLSKNDQNKIRTSFDLICKEEILASNNFKTMNNALETLIFLKSKNLSLCLVTMQCKDALEKVLQKLQISDLFDSVISRDESFDRQKQIELSLQNVVLTPSEVLVVGDRIHDIESAKKIGCMPILKINEIEKIPPFQCKTINDLIELKTIV
jgi:HAD superfamily hydrolase (TIGR01549 family)